MQKGDQLPLLLLGNLGDGQVVINESLEREPSSGRGKSSCHGRSMARVPGFVKIGQTSVCYPRIPFGVLSLISEFGSRGAWLRLRLRLLFATMFRLKLLRQFALNAGMRRHYLIIRLCQSF